MKPPKFRIGGIIQKRDLASIGIMGIPNRPGVAGAILGALGDKGINCPFIVQLSDAERQDSVVLGVAQSQLEAALDILKATSVRIDAQAMTHGSTVAMLAIFGPHFGERPGIAGAMFTALAAAGINTLSISTSVSTISCLIEDEQLDDAVQVLRETFLPPRTSC